MIQGTDAFGEVPIDRWDVDAVDNEGMNAAVKSRQNFGQFLEGAQMFDAKFFGISGAEAQNMDPQQRLLLEVGYEALHDSGATKESLRGSNTGIFVGIQNTDFAQLQIGSKRASSSV